MKKLIGGMIATVALAVGCGAEDPAPAPANQNILGPVQPEVGPEGLPEGYVETPFGGFHQSCVHEVPDEGEVNADGAIWMRGQMMRAPSPCAFKSFRADQGRVIRGTNEDNVTRPYTLDGWVSYVEAPANNMGVSPPRFNGVESTLTIPPAPTVKLFQLIYLFSSLTPSDGKAILQPVIQWGGAAGQKWMAAGWFIDRAGNVYNSTRVNVTAGEKIVGTMRDVYHSCVGTNCKWDVKVLRGTTAISSLRVNTTEAWSVVQKAVFEAYSLTACRQLPAGNALFMNTKVYEPYDPSNLGARIEMAGSLNWKTTINTVSPSCAFNVVTPNPQVGVLTWNPN